MKNKKTTKERILELEIKKLKLQKELALMKQVTYGSSIDPLNINSDQLKQ